MCRVPHTRRVARSGTAPIARLSACLVAFTALALAACSGGEESSDSVGAGPKPVSVELLKLEPEPVRDVVALTGELLAENTGSVRSEVSGVIEGIRFQEGQQVMGGDVLFRLRDGEQRARLMIAQAEQRLAQDVFDRTQNLTSKDVSSLARRIEAAAELDKAKAQTALARVELDRTKVRAPFDGVMGARMVAPGDRVENDEALVEIYAIDRLQAAFTVQEQGVPLAKVGLPLHVRVAAWPGERFPGVVFYVSPALDGASRRLVLKAWIDNAEHRLKPGMFVNVDVEIASVDAALMVPEAAIVYDRHGIYVWREGEGSQAEKVPVSLGIRQEGRVEVTEGLGAGDVIVAAGTHKVMAGSLLRDPSEPSPAVHAREGRTAPEPLEGES